MSPLPGFGCSCRSPGGGWGRARRVSNSSPFGLVWKAVFPPSALKSVVFEEFVESGLMVLDRKRADCSHSRNAQFDLL